VTGPIFRGVNNVSYIFDNWVLSADLKDYSKQVTVLTVKPLSLQNRNVD
jgi:hypothetical protein